MPGWRVAVKILGALEHYYVDDEQAPNLPQLIRVLQRNHIDPKAVQKRERVQYNGELADKQRHGRA